MRENRCVADYAIDLLMSVGVQSVTLAPGARLTPLISPLQSASCTLFWWVDERSAAFFALGRAKRDLLPSAVVTTSGTAVGELYPSVMEAYHAGIPLVIVTADRPQRFRGSGAPQSTQQVGIFGEYVWECIDLVERKQVDLTKWNKKKPLHLNVCFEEPERL